MTEPLSIAPTVAERHPRRGYLMAATAATLWAVNGTVSKVILASGLSSLRLTEVRSAGAFIGLTAVVALTAPSRLRTKRRELPLLVLFGVGGLAFVQWFYFLAIHRIDIGISLLIEYLAPLLVAIWAHFVFHQPVRRRLWAALALAVAGLALIVDVNGRHALSTPGIVFSLLAALAYALYVLLAEHAVGERVGRDVVSLLAWGFGFATLFWGVIAPWWTFPGGIVGERVSLLGHLAGHHIPVWALMTWMVVMGTIIPFFLLISALRHLSATRVGIIAMLEPVVATIVAWAWLGESLGAIQLVGATVVLAAIVLAQTAR